MRKRMFSLLICMGLLLGMALSVNAEETVAAEAESRSLTISSREEFLAFAENCRLDSYSWNLVVSLEENIDLTGCDFKGIPIFSGTFAGNNRKITGLSITGDGSMQGLFRHLTATAKVQDLYINAVVQPGGSQNQVGVIAGLNEGKILNCGVSAVVSGGDYVGGMAGVNGITGMIDSCHMSGEVYGNHFVGGIAGENCGVIRNCSNNALINTTPQQNSVEIEDITLDTLTNTESANTVTDIGGIAGSSSGVIRGCKNHADVGYPHMGYNIGGIAGTQSGYITGCENRGEVQGRKEVGGIVGQMEPASVIEYTEDTLQILKGQLKTMSGLVNRASGNAQSNANGISSQIGVLQDQTKTATDAIDAMLPDPDAPELPDPDTILAAQNTLSATLNAMPDTLNSIASATQTTLYSLTRDLNAISGQINAMGQTLDNASENLGGTITDVSDEDTPEQLTGKVENCVNYGSVLADLNVGGICGAIAMENDLDLLEDWEQNGEESLNFRSEIRAVVLNCKNFGQVTGKKQNVGGIAGWQSMGLVKECANTAVVDGENAEYVGGISGLSTGFLRSDYAKCEIYGKAFVGGIAGSGTIVSDSLSQVKLLGVRERQGAILGFEEESYTEEEAPVAGNFYLRMDSDPGAIDGISYSGMAEAMELEAFMGIRKLPDIFRKVTVRFVFGDGKISEVTVAPGDALSMEKIPAVPEKDGLAGSWEGMEEAKLTDILFDMTFEAVYTAYIPTIQTAEVRENGLPVVLAEGAFTDRATVSVKPSEEAPVLEEGAQLLEAWTITLTEAGTTARLCLPEGLEGESVKLLSCQAGAWQEQPFHLDGTYLVFDLTGNEMTVALVQEDTANVLLYAAIGAALVVAMGTLWFRKKRGNQSRKQENTAC